MNGLSPFGDVIIISNSLWKGLSRCISSFSGRQVCSVNDTDASKYGTLEKKVPLTKLGKVLQHNIAARGAITVADFMKECLQHPLYGYYMKENVLGRRGDFVTAPEISQTFGEMVGLWFVSLAETRYSHLPKPFRLVELGPGNGTLMNDMLRTLSRFPWFYRHTVVHLVETSPTLAKQQQLTLARYQQQVSRRI